MEIWIKVYTAILYAYTEHVEISDLVTGTCCEVLNHLLCVRVAILNIANKLNIELTVTNRQCSGIYQAIKPEIFTRSFCRVASSSCLI